MEDAFCNSFVGSPKKRCFMEAFLRTKKGNGKGFGFSKQGRHRRCRDPHLELSARKEHRNVSGKELGEGYSLARKQVDLLDETGREILRLLRRSARMSLREIGVRVSLSPPAVAERVRRMEENGLIVGYAARVDCEKAGCPIHVMIQILGAKDRSMINGIAERVPEVIQYWVLTGEIDYIVELAVSGQKRLEQVIRELEKIGATRTHLVIYQDSTR